MLLLLLRRRVWRLLCARPWRLVCIGLHVRRTRKQWEQIVDSVGFCSEPRGGVVMFQASSFVWESRIPKLSLRILAQPSKRGTDVLPGRWRRLEGCCRETGGRDSVIRAGKVLPLPRIGKVKIGEEKLVKEARLWNLVELRLCISRLLPG